MQGTITLKEIVGKMKLILGGFLLFYIICFQYVFFSIDGLLTILGGVLILLEILGIRYIGYYRNIGFVLGFIIVSFVMGFLFAYDQSAHVELVMEMLQLCLPMVFICGYVGRNEKNFLQILCIVSISVFVLAVSLFTKGVVYSYYGSLTVGDLNTNVFSSFLMIGLIANLILLSRASKISTRIVLVAVILIELVVQMKVASRRGVIVFAFLLLAYFHSIMFIYYREKIVYKIVSFFVVMAIVLWFVVNYTRFSETFVVLQRFRGAYTVGDATRDSLQHIAEQLFWGNPVFGQGFGCVEAVGGVYSHSMYFEVLASTGIIGAVILFLSMIRNIIKFYIKSRKDVDIVMKMWYRTGMWGMIAVFLTGIAVVSIFDSFFYIILGLFGALLNVERSASRDDKMNLGRSSRN